MNFEIRYAKREELEAVNEIRKQVHNLHAEGRPDIFPKFSDELMAHIYDMFDDENMASVVAVSDGKIIGYAGLNYFSRPKSIYMNERKFCNIEEFGVLEGYRRMGVATALVDFVRSEAGKKGFERVELNYWSFNEDAKKFYENYGFRVMRTFMEIEAKKTLGEPTFRRATENDKDKILSLYKSVLGEEFSVWSEEYPTEDEIENDFAHDNLFVMADGDRIAGAISIESENELDGLMNWQVSGEECGEITRVVVDRDYRGKNLSAKMVRVLSMMLREKGKTAVHLLVAKKNIPARKIYERCGFIQIGECFVYGNDFYAMEKIL